MTLSMSQATQYRWLFVAALLLLSTGCAPDQVRMLEQRGEHHKAYELCRQALAVNPQDQSAALGLRRNAPGALAYWREEAVVAAMRHDWRRAALCHRQVLEIKPDEKGSIDALRQLAAQHPGQVVLASGPVVPATSATTRPAAEIAMGPPVASNEPAADEHSEAPTPARGGPNASEKAAAAPPGPSRPGALADSTPGAAPSTAPAGRRVDAHKQNPSVRRERGASQAEVAMIVYISREDHRYPKRSLLTDGLSIKVKDTDPDPLDADLEVYLSNRRIGKFSNLRIGSVLIATGRSGRDYELMLLHIEDDTETVKIGLRPSQGPEQE
jgi:hypothetical protein